MVRKIMVVLAVGGMLAANGFADESAIDTVQSSVDSGSTAKKSTYAVITQKKYSSYIGVAAGLTTGYGLSYRHWFGSGWGVQINLFPYYLEETNPYGDYYGYYSTSSSSDSTIRHTGNLSLGLTALRSVMQLEYLRILLYGGGNLNADYLYVDQWSSYNQTHYITDKLTNRVTLGFGGGLEWFVWRFAFHAMIGIQGSVVAETLAKGAGFSYEGGVHFRF